MNSIPVESMTDNQLKKFFYEYAETTNSVHWLLGWLKSAHLGQPTAERNAMVYYLKDKGVL